MSSVGIQLVKRQIRDDESCEPSAMEALLFPYSAIHPQTKERGKIASFSHCPPADNVAYRFGKSGQKNN